MLQTFVSEVLKQLYNLNCNHCKLWIVVDNSHVFSLRNIYNDIVVYEAKIVFVQEKLRKLPPCSLAVILPAFSTSTFAQKEFSTGLRFSLSFLPWARVQDRLWWVTLFLSGQSSRARGPRWKLKDLQIFCPGLCPPFSIDLPCVLRAEIEY